MAAGGGVYKALLFVTELKLTCVHRHNCSWLHKGSLFNFDYIYLFNLYPRGKFLASTRKQSKSKESPLTILINLFGIINETKDRLLEGGNPAKC